ncbi:tetratricopeptide repeat protein [Maridesulfovibrio bastinii]|uniref:tetratricopeptide repeat protein n=1 Tax=Maridesulfovibrio bastinii TaxID=47157 RepID=UPI0004063A84|nr:hypothetical protein [Maridesulfovibrio bastinii]
MKFFFRIVHFLILLTILTTVNVSASKSVFIGNFESQDNATGYLFSSLLKDSMMKQGLNCVVNGTTPDKARYSVNGIIETGDSNASYSAILSDRFNLEPDLFFKGVQKGGSSLQPAADKLSSSIASKINQNVITAIDVSGELRLTPGAVIAISEILPGEKADVANIIAARIILENCGLFRSARIFLESGNKGKILHFLINEGPMLSARNIEGTGSEKTKESLLKSSRNSLPSFRIFPENVNATCLSGLPAFKAGELITDFEQVSDQKELVSILEKIINVSEKIRQDVAEYSNERRSESIILVKLCSLLNSDKVKKLDRYFRTLLRKADTEEKVEHVVNLTALIDRSIETASRIEEIIGSRLFLEKPHSPASPMILEFLGNLASMQGENDKAESLYQMAINSSGLPVPARLLINLAECRYRSLNRSSGDKILEMLEPQLAPQVSIKNSTKARIKELNLLSKLCMQVENVADNSKFEALLAKGHALISLRRADLAEPLFHQLHGLHPDDARPFTGFARLAIQRSGKMSSAKTYLEKSRDLKNKDSMYYELGLGYVLDRIINEALPDFEESGKTSDQASAILFLLPDAFNYAKGYGKFNPGQSAIIESALRIFKDWINSPENTASNAFDNLFLRAGELRDEYPQSNDCAAAEIFNSIFASRNGTQSIESEDINMASIKNTPQNATQILKLLRLNVLINNMNNNPDKKLSEAVVSSVQSIAPGYTNRRTAITTQADGLVMAGLYMNNNATINKAKSLYYMVAEELNGCEKVRVLNNLGVISALIGHKDEADDLFNESMDANHRCSVIASDNKSFIHNQPVTNSTAEKIETTSEHSKINGFFAVLKDRASLTPVYSKFGKLNLIFDYKSSPWLDLDKIKSGKKVLLLEGNKIQKNNAD